MSDHLDRAAEVIAAQMHGLTTPSMCRGIARALEEAGLLAFPERDAKALRDAADALEGGVTAHDLEAITFGRRSAVAALRDRADRIEGESS